MKTLAALLLLCLLAPGAALAANEGFWCGQRIVQVGDPVWQVARRCPEPFWRETRERPTVVDRHGHVLGLARVEIWTLNFGRNRFMRQLEFVDGRLSRVRELGYGVSYEPGSRRCDPLDLGQAGETTAEIFARCGPPDFSYELSEPMGYAPGWHRSSSAFAERLVWTYEFDGRQRPRELLFVDGRLRRIDLP
ncbi:MAG: DUF2845 domain-containing protein [Gammaproteobacteria bacterium]|jgi:hypothetical protein|nr:DUF2845 domain-containing protein [Gammaproteobacteria bacterium]